MTGTATGGGTDYTFDPSPQTVTFNGWVAAQTENVSLVSTLNDKSEVQITVPVTGISALD